MHPYIRAASISCLFENVTSLFRHVFHTFTCVIPIIFFPFLSQPGKNHQTETCKYYIQFPPAAFYLSRVFSSLSFNPLSVSSLFTYDLKRYHENRKTSEHKRSPLKTLFDLGNRNLGFKLLLLFFFLNFVLFLSSNCNFVL